MLIFIDSNYNIKAINNSDDKALTCIEIDREKVFHGFSDFMILNYKYIPQREGYTICPSRDYNELLYLESKETLKKSQNKIVKLEDSQSSQDSEILMNMMAITEMYEMNISNVRSLSTSEPTIPVNILNIYQKLFDLDKKDITEIPYHVRKKIKAK